MAQSTDGGVSKPEAAKSTIYLLKRLNFNPELTRSGCKEMSPTNETFHINFVRRLSKSMDDISEHRASRTLVLARF